MPHFRYDITAIHRFLFSRTFEHNGLQLIFRPHREIGLWLLEQPWQHGVAGDGRASSILSRLKVLKHIRPADITPIEANRIRKERGLTGRGQFWVISDPEQAPFVQSSPYLSGQPAEPATPLPTRMYLGLDYAKAILELCEPPGVATKALRLIETAMSHLPKTEDEPLSKEVVQVLKKVAGRLKRIVTNRKVNIEVRIASVLASGFIAETLHLPKSQLLVNSLWIAYIRTRNPKDLALASRVIRSSMVVTSS